MSDLHRRRALQLLGSGAGLAVLAGCSSSDDRNDADESNGNRSSIGNLPSYASILPETGSSAYFYGAIDLATMTALVDDDDVEAGEEPSDPLLGNPILVAFLCAYGVTELSASPGAAAFAANDETDGEQTLLFVDGVYAFAGSYAVGGLRSDLEDAGYVVERDDAVYAVYTHPETDDAVGVSETVFVFGQQGDEFDAVGAVERVVETATGGREPKHETDDDFETLLRAGTTDGIELCLYTADDEFADETLTDDQPEDDADDLRYEFEPFRSARGVLQHLSLPDIDGRARATAVVDYSSDDRVDEDRLESGLGMAGDTVSFDRDGPRVTIDADYDDGVAE